jgi:glutamate 5-kinase
VTSGAEGRPRTLKRRGSGRKSCDNTAVIVIAKIGTSSLTDASGALRSGAIDKLCAEVAAARSLGIQIILVTSGAISAGLPALGFEGQRPRDARTLQAASAVGQGRLLGLYDQSLGRHGIVAGQVLLAPLDFFERNQYLHAKGTLQRLLELDVVPIVNENDAVADDAIRFGDNDRIAALVAHLVHADRLVLLTDTDGLYTADPRNDPDAQLIPEIAADHVLDADLGGAGTDRGSGGMASKLAAARIAAWSGVTTVIAAADRADVLAAAIDEVEGVGTIVRPHPHPLSARKLWIAFALEPAGRLTVDAGARAALERSGGSLLAVGVSAVEGIFGKGDALEVVDLRGETFARGLSAMSSTQIAGLVGTRSHDHPEGTPDEVIHRDELVLLG